MSSLLSRITCRNRNTPSHHLGEPFPEQDKQQAPYTIALDGRVVPHAQAKNVLGDFLACERPFLLLHIPKNETEERREFRLCHVGKETLIVEPFADDPQCDAFLRQKTPLHWSLEFDHHKFFFATTALGRCKGEIPAYQLALPEQLYQERRSGRRYRLQPTYEATFNGMPVIDLSQKGLRFCSHEEFQMASQIADAPLALPRVESCEGKELFPGTEILISQTEITNRCRSPQGFLYGTSFTEEWTEEAIKTLNNFFLALRKREREEEL
ncbi:MAG: hypothetical protein R6Y91_03310 [Desulfohalobium sp.]